MKFQIQTQIRQLVNEFLFDNYKEYEFVSKAGNVLLIKHRTIEDRWLILECVEEQCKEHSLSKNDANASFQNYLNQLIYCGKAELKICG